MQRAHRLQVVLASMFLAASAFGQSLNVDIGNACGTPSESYAARGLAGTWNTICSDGSARHGLLRLYGTPSAVVLEANSYLVPCEDEPWYWDDAFALFGDGVAVTDHVGVWVLTGLENGTYTTITYAWEPGTLTHVNVCARGPCFPSGGADIDRGYDWVQHSVRVDGGVLIISAAGGYYSSGAVNGFQLILEDCNHNGSGDDGDIHSGASIDCNRNRVPDECEMDCDANGIFDPCEATFADCNVNRINDSCEEEYTRNPEFPAGDFNCDGAVDWVDFRNWHRCMAGPEMVFFFLACEAFDFDADRDVDLLDYSALQSVASGP